MERRKLSRSENGKKKIGKEKECAGMKESFSKWLKDSIFYVSVARGGLSIFKLAKSTTSKTTGYCCLGTEY